MNPSESDIKPETQIEQVQTAPQDNQQQDSPPIKSEENQANWKAFREQRAAERKARIEFEKKASEKAAEAEALRAALEAITNKPAPRQENYYEEPEESEEQRIEKRVVQILEERERKKNEEDSQREASEYPNRLNSTYKDFKQVCSTENLDYLEFNYPEIARPFKYMPDGYEKWEAIYLATKRFVPNLSASADRNKAERNLAKPGSISSPTTTPQGNGNNATRLDESRKAANWERMQRTIKGISS